MISYRYYQPTKGSSFSVIERYRYANGAQGPYTGDSATDRGADSNTPYIDDRSPEVFMTFVLNPFFCLV